ncbi:MAG: SprT-like domain-containing protein [Thermoguttaceae bacterium]
MNNEKLQTLFESVADLYFQEWPHKEWQVVFEDLKAIDGMCICPKKTIKIKRRLSKNDEITKVTIIHEIAHAVASDQHDDVWRNEILRTAEVARKKGDRCMVKLLKGEAKHVSLFDSEENFYTFIEEQATRFPGIRFETILSKISEGTNYNPKEITQKFPEARKRYNERRAIIRTVGYVSE